MTYYQMRVYEKIQSLLWLADAVYKQPLRRHCDVMRSERRCVGKCGVPPRSLSVSNVPFISGSVNFCVNPGVAISYPGSGEHFFILLTPSLREE